MRFLLANKLFFIRSLKPASAEPDPEPEPDGPGAVEFSELLIMLSSSRLELSDIYDGEILVSDTQEYLKTEEGEYLTTEDGRYLITE